MREKIEKLIPGYAAVPLFLAVVINMIVYDGSALLQKYLTFYSLELPIDAKLPFVAPFVAFYILAFAQWIISYVLIARESREFCRHFVYGDIIAKIFCLFFFIFFPTTLERPEVTGNGFFEQLVRFIYDVDAPVNLFPSIHCLESWCCIRAAFSMRKTPRWYRMLTVFMSLGVFASTLFIKQHVLLDVFGGIAVYEAGYFIAGKIGGIQREKNSP